MTSGNCLALLLLLLSKQAEGGNTCNSPWFNLHGSSCYALYSVTLTEKYEEANTICGNVGAHVYVPNSEGEYNDVSAYLVSIIHQLQHVWLWIGCDETEDDGVFQCADGTELDSDSGWWQDLYPTPGGSHRCVDLYGGTFPHKIYDHSCMERNTFFCEVPPTSPPTSGPTQGQVTTPFLVSTLSTVVTDPTSSAAPVNGDDTTATRITSDSTNTSTAQARSLLPTSGPTQGQVTTPFLVSTLSTMVTDPTSSAAPIKGDNTTTTSSNIPQAASLATSSPTQGQVMTTTSLATNAASKSPSTTVQETNSNAFNTTLDNSFTTIFTTDSVTSTNTIPPDATDTNTPSSDATSCGTCPRCSLNVKMFTHVCPEISGRNGVTIPAIIVYFTDRDGIKFGEVCEKLRAIQRTGPFLFRQKQRFQKIGVLWGK
ncbi:mucin-5AC-like [Lytechinus pictus]|uniref:mucin-5AC-like n=1 Tax=Lytechinus pictus TaxID=7653 RepID=UPI0030BA20D9